MTSTSTEVLFTCWNVVQQFKPDFICVTYQVPCRHSCINWSFTINYTEHRVFCITSMTGLKHKLFLFEGQKKVFVISPSSLHLCDILQTKAEPSLRTSLSIWRKSWASNFLMIEHFGRSENELFFRLIALKLISAHWHLGDIKHRRIRF